jgi:Protein of unknown function (DUF4065)
MTTAHITHTKADVRYDEEKLVALVLYAAAKCATDAHYGVLKLNRILFYADFKAYRALGRPITGAEYKKYTHGPAPHVMRSLKQRLINEGSAFEYVNPLPYLTEDNEPMQEKRLFPKIAPDMAKLSTDETAIVDSVIEWLRPMTGVQVSRMSHRHPGWNLAAMEEVIPYFSELLVGESRPLSKADFARASCVADRYEKRSTAA